MNDIVKRECGDCHKCCEGYLVGEVYGFQFQPGRPCHYLSVGKGCSIYDKRPEHPCKSYRCEWLQNPDVPEWFKPNKVNAILSRRKVGEYEYWDLMEAGEKLDSAVLNWIFLQCVNTGMNLVYRISGGVNWLGSEAFILEYKRQVSDHTGVAG